MDDFKDRDKDLQIAAASVVPVKRGRRRVDILFPGQPCYYCGDAAESVDHKIPYSRGGRDGPNLVPACHRCNQMKGDLTVEEFIDRLKVILWALESKKVIQAGKDVLRYPVAA